MKKMKNSFSGVLFGIVFIIVGTILLFWNESNNVKNLKTVKEIDDQAIFVDSTNIASENENKLIVTNGNLNVADDIVSDSVFNVGIKTAKLERVVEMYQWKEESSEDNNDNKTYSYSKEWATSINDSSTFHDSRYSNPTSMPYVSETFVANNVSVGEFNLTTEQKKSMSVNETLNMLNISNIPQGFNKTEKYITNSNNISSPEIGDIRISYHYNNWTDATVLAVQSGTTFKDFLSSAGKSINRIDKGKLSKTEMVQNITNENNMVKWIIRGVGTIIIILGYSAVIGPLTTLTSFVPILGSLVGSVLSTVMFLIGLIHSLVIIMIAWIMFRPLVGIFLMVVIIGLIVLLQNIIRKNTTNQNDILKSSNIETNTQVVTNQSVNNNEQYNPVNQNTFQTNFDVNSMNQQSFANEQTINNTNKNTFSTSSDASLMNQPPLVNEQTINTANQNTFSTSSEVNLMNQPPIIDDNNTNNNQNM